MNFEESTKQVIANLQKSMAQELELEKLWPMPTGWRYIVWRISYFWFMTRVKLAKAILYILKLHTFDLEDE